MSSTFITIKANVNGTTLDLPIQIKGYVNGQEVAIPPGTYQVSDSTSKAAAPAADSKTKNPSPPRGAAGDKNGATTKSPQEVKAIRERYRSLAYSNEITNLTAAAKSLDISRQSFVQLLRGETYPGAEYGEPLSPGEYEALKSATPYSSPATDEERHSAQAQLDEEYGAFITEQEEKELQAQADLEEALDNAPEDTSEPMPKGWKSATRRANRNQAAEAAAKEGSSTQSL